MRQVCYHGLTLNKLQPGVYKLTLMEQDLTIESRGIYHWMAYGAGRNLVAQAGSLPALCKELRRLADERQ